MSAFQVWGWQSFFSEIQSFLQLVQLLENGQGRQEHIENCLERLHTVIFNVTTIRDILSGNSADPILVQYKELVDELLMHLQQFNAFLNGSLDHSLAESVAYRASVIRTHQRDRPGFAVTIDQLKYLRSLSFSWIRISRMLGISRMTLNHRRQQFNMLHDYGGITIQYQELVEILLNSMRHKRRHNSVARAMEERLLHQVYKTILSPTSEYCSPTGQTIIYVH